LLNTAQQSISKFKHRLHSSPSLYFWGDKNNFKNKRTNKQVLQRNRCIDGVTSRLESPLSELSDSPCLRLGSLLVLSTSVPGAVPQVFSLSEFLVQTSAIFICASTCLMTHRKDENGVYKGLK